MTTPELEYESVLDRVVPVDYGPEAIAAYELARELVRNAIGVCSGRQWELEHPEPEAQIGGTVTENNGTITWTD